MNPDTRIARVVQSVTRVEPDELAPCLWSLVYFFCLLCGYFVLRPIREEMGVANGVENLQWLFTGTFITMLAVVPIFGAVVRRWPRRLFMPGIYYFFIANILLFYVLFELDILAAHTTRVFFVWISVFNLFVVSVFWSFMADIFAPEQARRLFGFIAAGGSAGALTGPLLTALLAPTLGVTNMLLVAATILSFALVAMHKLTGFARGSGKAEDKPIGGSVLGGLKLVARSPYLMGICLLILIYTTLATFLYFHQARLVEQAFTDPGERTAMFAFIDFAVNALTLSLQLLLTARIVRRLGIGWTLAIIPCVVVVGFLSLALVPTLAMLVVVQITRRAGNYAVMKPARDMLYSVVDRESKYKAKNFIDTAVYRGGDAMAGWAYTGLGALGLGLSGIAWIGVPLALLWIYVSLKLGQAYKRLAGELPGKQKERVHA